MKPRKADATTTIDRLIGAVLKPHIRDSAHVTILANPSSPVPSPSGAFALFYTIS
jgi:hypothetical protein